MGKVLSFRWRGQGWPSKECGLVETSHGRGPLRWISFAVGIAVVSAWVFACGDANLLGAGVCEFTFQCRIGEVCSEGRCVPAERFVPGGGAGGVAGEGGAGGVAGSGGVAGEGGAGGDVGEGGAGGAAAPRVTFAPSDFRRCFDSLECAVFGGNCLIELPLSRPLPDGTDRIKLSDLDPTLEEGEGICGAPCTNEPRVCESMVVTGPDGQVRPSTCQLIYVGESPYPEEPPPFPFVLDMQSMARGVPHASICRLPFEDAEAHSPSFCAACTEAAHCAEGDACWLDRPFAGTPSGACVQTCDLQSDCPFGFRCTDVDESDDLLVGEAGSYCLPLAGTCGRCLDQDGDQRGVGFCGPLDEPFTEVDCDDGDPNAYFDPTRPLHPFPRFCGDFDLNCNGLSDQVEQLGSEEHCSSCGDFCAGQVPNGIRGCVEGDAGWACNALCQPGFADCNGDVEDGCETALEDGMLWARDRDGDGRGNPLEMRYFCEGEVPPGWVQNTLDCDDADPTRYAGGETMQGLVLPPAPELCDGIDNDCNGVVDDGIVVSLDETGAVAAVAGEFCDTGLDGVCGVGTYVCKAGGGETLPGIVCVPNVDPATQVYVDETCNGLDDDCDGTVDDDVDWYRDNSSQSNPDGPGAPKVCEVPGGKGICGFGVYQCGFDANGDPGWLCIPNEPEDEDPMGDGVDTNCDGIDGVLEGSIFLRPVAGGGTLNGNDLNDGSAQAPVATVNRAIELACADRTADEPCRDIYLDQGVYVSNEAIVIPGASTDAETIRVRIYGGFSATIECDGNDCELIWERTGNARSVIMRTAPTPSSVGPAINGDAYPYGKKYAAIAGDGSGIMELLLDRVDVQVRAPDPSYIMPDGSSAPAQIGLECPASGCGRLELKDVEIQVDDGIGGAMGAVGEMGAFPPTGNNGTNGCALSERCDPGIFYGACHGNANYAYVSMVDRRTEAAQCADGTRPHGGSGGGVGCYYWLKNKDLDHRIRTDPFPGGGRSFLYGIPGDPGRRGYYVEKTGGATLAYGDDGPDLGWRHQAARAGTSGGGGWGGMGEPMTVAFFRYEHAMPIPSITSGFLKSIYVVAMHRGASGGAGGCNGTQGGRGGDGGSSIGMVLRAPNGGSLELITPGAFAVRAGRGGGGGNGGKGGNGAAGGWGGSGHPTEEEEEHRGFEGGNGGGGGGGAGGHGGLSIGIWRVCTRAGGTEANGCGIELPALLKASPDLFVAPGDPGKPGEGGEGGKTGEKTMHSHQRNDLLPGGQKAGDGDDGRAGQSHYLFFSGGA